MKDICHSRMKKELRLVLMVILVTFFPTYQPISEAIANISAPTATQITNCSQLQAMKNNLSGLYVLSNDIDCFETQLWNAGQGFEPIGTLSNNFIGILDGKGYTIYGLYINRPDDWNVGLFSYTGATAQVQDVSMKTVTITGEKQVGALIGANQGTVNGCSSAGNVMGTLGSVGGLIGYSTGTVSMSHSSVSASGGALEIHYVGGLIGENRGLLQKSYATGDVSGEEGVGGLVGENISGTISQCYATGTVTGGNGASGGLVGGNSYNNALIHDSYATGTVLGGSGAYAKAGGLLGSNGGTGWATESVANCYSLGPVTGDNAGGLVGRNNNNAPPPTITGSYWDLQTSGIAVSEGGIGKLTAGMYQQSTFAGWDFDNIWRIQEGRIYPWFTWQQRSGTDLITCESSGNQNFYWANSTNGVVRECTLTLPEAGVAMISADATLAYYNGNYEAKFQIGIDTQNGDGLADRWVTVDNGSPGGAYNNMSLSTMKPLSAGTHTVYLVVSRGIDPGTVYIWDSTLSVIVNPAPHSDLMTCENSGNLTWYTTATSFQEMRQCSLDLPAHGWVYISSDATMDVNNDAYAAQFRLGIDSILGDGDVDRWVSVYGISSNDSDETMTIAGFWPVYAGEHSFYLLGKRYSGTGTVRVYDPTLNVLYFPAPSISAMTCADSGNQSQSVSGTGYTAIRECELDLQVDSWVYISGNASLYYASIDSTAQIRIGIDDYVSGDLNIDRLADLRADTGPGSYNNLAITNLRWVSKGTHKFYLLARPFNGIGTAGIFDSTLSVMAFGMNKVHLPVVLKAEP